MVSSVNITRQRAAVTAFLITVAIIGLVVDNNKNSNNNLRRVLFDPATVIKKSHTNLDYKPASIAYTLTLNDFQDEEYLEEQKLRFVSFGTSRAWGADLPDRDTQTYTALLGGTNLAIRASDARYPAMCTYSMLREEIYDVILIEYFLSYKQEAVLQLGRRLRQRFPDARIIYINVWVMHENIEYRDQGRFSKNFWTNSTDDNDEQKLEAFLSALEKSSNEEWKYHDTNLDFLKEEIKNDPYSHILHYESPHPSEYKEAIRANAEFHLPDLVHFSKYGHKWIMHQVAHILRISQHKRSDEVNPWNRKDQCLTWYETGDDMNSALQTNMPMVDFSKGKKKGGAKYALEANQPNQPSYILVNNTDSEESKYVYLSYMVTGPNDDIYGGAKIELRPNSWLETPTASVEINTLSKAYSHPFHITSHRYIGAVPPKVLTYLVIEGNMTGTATAPFRTIGMNVGEAANTELRGFLTWFQ